MTNASVQDPLVTREVFAEELAISIPTLWRYVHQGVVPKPIKIGNRAGWPRSVVNAWKIEQGWPKQPNPSGDAA